MNRTRRKTFSLLLALCMVLTLLPTTAFATVAESDVASIEDTGYATLAEAVEAAQAGDTIKLIKDVSVGAGEYITIDKNVVIDGDGNKIIKTAADGNDYGMGILAITSASGATVMDVVFEGLEKFDSQETAVYLY